MLLLGHIGYTVGAVATLEGAARGRLSVDYRAVAVMSLAPDIIDRGLFVFALPSAMGGRLVAHTLLFQAILFSALVLVNPRFWIYGAASAFHLILDTTHPSVAWAHHVLWPFLGADWKAVDIAPGLAKDLGSYSDWTVARAQTVLAPYQADDWLAWALELGGALVLAWFVYRRRLYRVPRLREFLVKGSA
ncbi:MAG: hypothetical protein Q8P22_00775 [Chloroflexota bacterium]|nr:hypothetical protein [Chloroflexota bacterium]